MLALLGLGAAVVWVVVVDTKPRDSAGTHCAPPAQPTSAPVQPPPELGQHLEPAELDLAGATPPAQASVRVLNASTQRGQATLVTENLRQLGFAQVGPAQDDPVYPVRDMTCRGQIRFGAQGLATARTLSLLEPCTELIKDNRQDATVDLVLGKRFDDLPLSRAESRQILQQITDYGSLHPAESGGLQAEGKAAAGPSISPDLVDALRKGTC
jgi:hypothetical protein